MLGTQLIHFSKVHEVCIICTKSHVDPVTGYLLVSSGIVIQNNLWLPINKMQRNILVMP
jgi:hypothetical protein